MKLLISVLVLGALVAVNAEVGTTPFFGMLPPHYIYINTKMTVIYSFPIFVIVMFRKRQN